MNEVETESE